MSSLPGVAATNSGSSFVGGIPLTTPPQTPHSTASSISSSVLGKRDQGASESEKEETATKKRRIAPTLLGTGDATKSSAN
jgi:chromatin assembly factor 1 subunit B